MTYRSDDEISSKIFNDPIHDWAVNFIDTPQFQRLRNIKQLGTIYYVFPGASHNRFEHCLGTAYLANSWAKRLFEEQNLEQITSDDVKCVTLAALCHDLGHGPFSTVFEDHVIPRLTGNNQWKHEDNSKIMFEHMFKCVTDENGKNDADFDDKDYNIIRDLITGDDPQNKRTFIFDIVANKRNSIDVDKFDYLERDCYHLGMKSKFEFSRLMKFSRVIDDQIAYQHKEYLNISEMFHTRFSLHARIYNHRVSKALDFMVADALCEANHVLKISDAINDGEEFLKLSDNTLHVIEYMQDSSLIKSKEIINRIRHRKLYKFVDECLIPREYRSRLNETNLNKSEIIRHKIGNESISEDDIIIHKFKINYGKEDQNPLDYVKFYGNSKESFNLKKSEVSYLIPEQYDDEIVAVYAKDPEKDKPIQDAFRALMKELNLTVKFNQGSALSDTRIEQNNGTVKSPVYSTAVYGTRWATEPAPRYEIPEEEMPPEVAYKLIKDDLMLDGNPSLNLASFVTTYMEKEAEKLMKENLSKNFIDYEEYPVSVELQNRCVNMIARLFNAPMNDPKEEAMGVSTVGSSEAIMLSVLAMKKLWQKRMRAKGKPTDRPNLVMSASVQVCWEKATRYLEVEEKFVYLTEGEYILDPQKAVDLVDENTIGVCVILGSTYTGHYEDAKTVNDLLMEKNLENGWDVPIHIDAASGVRSINVSGHKYGLCYAGIGWGIWRSAKYLPEELIFTVNYLGCASHVIAQYYVLIRLGRVGFTAIMRNLMNTSSILATKLEETGKFKIISDRNGNGLPLVAFKLSAKEVHYDEFDVAKKLRERGWIVPAYTMAPNTEHIKVLRIVVREDFSRERCDVLVEDIISCLEVFLRDKGTGKSQD
ncbi:1692_t:CDS:10 [Diversispora eburnea]|uniref:glutamate decarboxylase n=1 Tax=Diversispora eburnea TaxID=1213867 RepID=A0A9N8W4E0_9GLOM|nr:1692_t:CDS:10 [Diversispora eburnea]